MSRKGASNDSSYGVGPYATTLCGRHTHDMTYAGRIDTPTCLECMAAP